MKKFKKLFLFLFVFIFIGTLASCNNKGNGSNSTNSDSTSDNGIASQFDCITIKEAIEIAESLGGKLSEDAYYVYGKVKTIKSYEFGEMIIEDETGEIYIYGVRGEGDVFFDKLEDQPKVGDEVVLYGRVKTYDGKPEFDRCVLKALKHKDTSDEIKVYETKTIKEARNSRNDSLVSLTGVVSYITKNSKGDSDGFYLVDNTGSTYVYGSQTATKVEVGNTVKVNGKKTTFIGEKEVNLAQKHNYEGAIQIAEPELVENDNGNKDFDKSWISETTIQDLVTRKDWTNITGTIFKTVGFINEVIEKGFTNYYLNDYDNKTGTYVYSKANGNDFAYMKEFDDGNLHEMYLSVINYKATSSGMVARFMPISINKEAVVYDVKNAPKYALDFEAIPQFETLYRANPNKEVVTSVSNSKLGFSDVIVSYESSNTDVASFDNVEGKLIFNVKADGNTTVKITSSYNGNTLVHSIDMKVDLIDYSKAQKVNKGVNANINDEVRIKGIVYSSLVNQDGFYIGDETGVIAVKGNKDDINKLKVGNEIYLEGIKKYHFKDGNQTHQVFIDATLIINLYGENEINPTTYVEKDMSELYTMAQDKANNVTTQVYRTKAIVKFVNAQHYTKYEIADPTNPKNVLSLYASGTKQYDPLFKDYRDQEVTIEFCFSDFSHKEFGYFITVLAVIDENGNRISNSLNFEK